MSENTKSIKSIYEREKLNTSRLYDAFNIIVPDYFELKQLSNSYPQKLRNVATLKLFYGDKLSLPDELLEAKIYDIIEHLESELKLFKATYNSSKYVCIPNACEMIMQGISVNKISAKLNVSYKNISKIRFIVINKMANTYQFIISNKS